MQHKHPFLILENQFKGKDSDKNHCGKSVSRVDHTYKTY